MAEADNANAPEYGDDDEPENGLFRWMSGLVVLLAVAGFFGLAWYAYKSGGDTVDEKDVELVKAEKAPVKEAPANPGGMQIPNQDKTVYGLVGGGKPDKAPVERILPAAEEPVARGGDTETWMSDKVKNKSIDEAAPPPQQVAVASPQSGAPPAEAQVLPLTDGQKAQQFNPEKVRQEESAAQTSTPAAPAVAEVKAKPAPVPATKTAETKKPLPAVTPAATPKAQAAPPKGARVQLGAYKSEKEANENWAKISRKFSDELGNKQHYVLRVSIPDKGTFYRLQVAPFASAKEAEQYCLSFVSAGQGCILAHAK